MKLLFLNPIGNIGGAERVLLAAIAGVKRELPTVDVRLLAFTDGPLLDAARELGAETEVLALPPRVSTLGDSTTRQRGISLPFAALRSLPTMWSFIRELRSRIAKYEPDLVHSNGIKTHLLSRFAVTPRIPVVWHVHDFYGLRPRAGWLLRRVRSRARAAVAVSRAVAVDALRVLPGVRVDVIPNAVNLDQFSPGMGAGEELDRLAGMEAAACTLRVGLVATYATWKGHLTMLDAAAKLAAERPAIPIRWYIVGGPIYQTAAQFTEAELRAAVEARGLAAAVGFVPFTANPVPVYRALDVVLHASTSPEPFGLTVAEAMACGRAVIVSAAGGAAELFTEGVDALGFPPGNVEQLAMAVRRLAADSGLRGKLGEAARRTAEKRFDSQQYGKQLAELYRSLCPIP